MHSTTLQFEPGFRVAFDVRGLQAAEMVIAAGGREGGPDNVHRGADQWLFVVAGRGEAIVHAGDGQRRCVPLQAGSLLLIERGERHEVRNTGGAPLQTLNFYNPPAFDTAGHPVGPGRGVDRQ